MISVGVVDYGSGNLRSVCKACEAVGASPSLINARSQLAQHDAVIVPGVGSFGDCAANLRSTELWDPLVEWIKGENPTLGICLGYQLLFDSSEESPGVQGLGILPGRVVRFLPEGRKVPQMGWNALLDTRGPLYVGLPTEPEVYFVHSYYPVPDDESTVSASCEYGGRFAASISCGALHATQYHPEKSQSIGLSIFKNFLATL